MPTRDVPRLPAALSPTIALVLLCSIGIVAWGVGVWTGLIGGAEPMHLRIATGRPDGVYHPLGSAFGDVLRRAYPKADIEVLSTPGSRHNMRLLEAGEVELAFAQDDTPLSPGARSVAILHTEVLHVLVRAALAAEVEDIADLRGRALVLGEDGSGTAAVSGDVLAHFGLKPDDYTPVLVGPGDIVPRMKAGTVDAAFVLSAMPSSVVDNACRSGLARLLPWGTGPAGETVADGLAAVDRRFEPAVIPPRAYAPEPAQPLRTVAVHAMLLASPTLDPALVYEVTRLLFENRAVLAESHPVGYQLKDRFEPAKMRYPPHPGAVAYYRRNEPAFVVQYAETIGLTFTVLVGIASGVAALRKWTRRRRKERIDRYYQRVAVATSSIQTDTPEELRSLLVTLESLRREAFTDLVNERLEADESFTIFQEFLRAEVDATRAKLQT